MSAVDVVIVGGGPVGWALAIELGQNGVSVVLAEKGDGVSVQPKMDILSVRTMEFCRRWGIVDRVLAAGYNRDYPQDCAWMTSLNGYELGREVFPSPRAEPMSKDSPEKRERCPQNFFDPVLAKRAQEFSCVDARYNTEFMGMQETDAGVRAVLRDLKIDKEYDVTASYLVGCDGGASAVRQTLGISTIGGEALTYTTNVIFKCPDFASLHDKPPAYRYVFIGPVGTWATIVAIDGRDTYRFSLVGGANKDKPNVDQLRAAIVRAMGKPFDFEIISVLPWVRREMVADRYRKGRAFLAGDSAHLNSPTGGFGMNTGLQDAVDIGWKLAAVICGWGGPQLLESYGDERLPVAHRNVKEATTNLKRMLSSRSDKPPAAMFEAGPAGDVARKTYGDMYTETMRPEWFTAGIHLGYRYARSSVIIPDGSPEPPDTFMTYEPTARPGHRAPHAWLVPGQSTLDLFGKYFVLLAFDATDTGECFEDVAAKRGMPLSIVRIESDDIFKLYGRVPLVLVRPDGFVAWRGASPGEDEAAKILDIVRGVTPSADTYSITSRSIEETRPLNSFAS